MRAKLSVPGVLRLIIAVATALGACAGPAASGSQPDAPETGAVPVGDRGMPMGPGMRGHGTMMGSSMQRRRQAMIGGITPAYRGLRNPFPPDRQVIAEGKALYLANCAACHGEQGAGNGPAAAGLSPPPADLCRVVRWTMAGDGYLMWAIGDGGIALGTSMPAFKDALGEAEHWKIVRYLRTL
jgi:mono/diheme cytochrome c family protein